MTRPILLLALPPLFLLAACGGMTRAVGVLPNATDDLARRTEPFRAGRSKADETRATPPPGGL